MTDTATTRSSHVVYLLGNVCGYPILGAKLPTIGQALSFFYYKLKKGKCTIRESATATVAEVEKTWKRAHLPTCQRKHGITRVEKFYENWRTLQKGAKRGGTTQREKEKEFKVALSKTLDLRHQDWRTLVTCQEDRIFLEDQFAGRKATLGSLDRVFEKQMKRKRDKIAAEDARKKKQQGRHHPTVVEL